jgi:hypothetical protein
VKGGTRQGNQSTDRTQESCPPGERNCMPTINCHGLLYTQSKSARERAEDPQRHQRRCQALLLDSVWSVWSCFAPRPGRDGENGRSRATEGQQSPDRHIKRARATSEVAMVGGTTTIGALLGQRRPIKKFSKSCSKRAEKVLKKASKSSVPSVIRFVVCVY